MPSPLPLAALPAPSATALPLLVPPPRFGETTFANYRPQHPSQHAALERCEAFARALEAAPARRWFWRRSTAGTVGQGLYLDGGFGVGKTHLLAATYAAFGGERAYLSFAELVHLIGVLGMDEASARFGERRLLCIDEFELDDPGNTLIVKTFLARMIAAGNAVMTTSNTSPEAQGQGRFNAQDFEREIQSLAAHFEAVPIEGADYRRRSQHAALPSEDELAALLRLEAENGFTQVTSTWSELFEVLRGLHPIRYQGLLAQVGVLYLSGARPIPDQNDALRFVGFIDKLYDLNLGLRLAGTLPLSELFDPSYRNSAYAKKHDRCLSRISELLEEAPRPNPASAD